MLKIKTAVSAETAKIAKTPEIAKTAKIAKIPMLIKVLRKNMREKKEVKFNSV